MDSEVAIKVKLRPFDIPNFIIEDREGHLNPRYFELREVNKETIEALCDEFRAEIMRKAGYEDSKL